jgi:hypothetical protein
LEGAFGQAGGYRSCFYLNEASDFGSNILYQLLPVDVEVALH